MMLACEVTEPQGGGGGDADDEDDSYHAGAPGGVELSAGALVVETVPVEDALLVLSAPGAQVAFVGRSLTPWPEQRESAKEMMSTTRTVSHT